MHYYWIIFFGIFSFNICAQSDSLLIREISIIGKHRTKESVIEREIFLKEGSYVAKNQLDSLVAIDTQLIMNTLFISKASCSIVYLDSNKVDLQYTLKEQGILMAIPYVELYDRNFNEWWSTYDHDFKRLNYALRTIIRNPTGNLDKAVITTQVGFTQRYKILYSAPYVDKSKKIGIGFEGLYVSDRSIAFQTTENKLEFFRNENTSTERIKIQPSVTFRPKIRTIHTLAAGYNHYKLLNGVDTLNSNYLQFEENKQDYFAIQYSIRSDFRDRKVYATKGLLLDANLLKEGIGFKNDLNTLYLKAKLNKYFQLHKYWSLNLEAGGKQELLGNKIPYYNSKSLGYENDYLRGYELYVIDGQNFIVTKQTLSWSILKRFEGSQVIPWNIFKKLPFDAYAKVYADQGYVSDKFHSKDNPLSNSWLTSYGFGFDGIFFSDILVSLEFSVNQMGEKGLYLHYLVDF